MASGNKFNCFMADLGLKQHNLGSDDLRLMLTDTSPVASNTITSNISEITPEHGYAAYGGDLTIGSYSQTSGLAKLIVSDFTFTASGGSFGPFRYVVLYNHTVDKLIGWWDDGNERTIADTEQYIVDFDDVNGVLAFQ